MLQDSKVWGCDGTFNVMPNLFDQLWCIHVRIAHTFVPAVFFLLSGRREALYADILKDTNYKNRLLRYGEINDFYFLKNIAYTIRLDKNLAIDEEDEDQ
jgi:hypothetical protein